MDILAAAVKSAGNGVKNGAVRKAEEGIYPFLLPWI